MFLAFQLVNIFHLMDDWHKSREKWCKFDSLVYLGLSKGATTVQKRQSVLFHYAFVGLFFELVDAQFYASVEVLNELRIEQT